MLLVLLRSFRRRQAVFGALRKVALEHVQGLLVLQLSELLGVGLLDTHELGLFDSFRGKRFEINAGEFHLAGDVFERGGEVGFDGVYLLVHILFTGGLEEGALVDLRGGEVVVEYHIGVCLVVEGLVLLVLSGVKNGSGQGVRHKGPWLHHLFQFEGSDGRVTGV